MIALLWKYNLLRNDTAGLIGIPDFTIDDKRVLIIISPNIIYAGNNMNSLIEKSFKKRLRNISPVSKEFSEKFLCQYINSLRISVIHIGGSQNKG
jgi:hypothetical protein